MTAVTVTGWSVLTSAGAGAAVLAGALRGRAPAGRGDVVTDMYPEPLPEPRAHVLTDFDVRARLGRKGTGSYDRATALAVVCCQDALHEAGTIVDDATRARVGVALGTSLGSFKSTSDYSRETLVAERPYQVNPLLFPNTVMNGAAGQVAIRFGLRAVNATIAGGPLAFLNAVRYAANAIDRGYADVMLTGAAEEFSPHRAWASHLTGATTAVASGEGAAVFVLAADGGPPEWAGTRRAARVLSVATGFGPDGAESVDEALAGCVARALAGAYAYPGEVSAVLTGEAGEDDLAEYGPAVRALGHRPERITTKALFGECDAASPAMGLGALLASGRLGAARDGLCLVTARGPDGAVGAALVEGAADAGADRR
ncbi:beta-ketoacyl synthase [Actinomadura sp. CNU-125]|uniref:beta-ketoacyl synthase N-terminal-like domain-containing protein n=1 Tax=Actinomadura sp. CNU-125 TaxID=1904961 RepID=UPI00096389E9|nr:beta-ketoacyl synthase N-terminal-like domain-containing protein [Actinomadura sp. CNU-125]OLT19151.1 beta-ketoacyl synthase [Actinomadura sp. CNU-125]